MLDVTGQEGEGRRVGGVPWSDSDRSRPRWRSGLLVAAAAVWLTVQMVSAAKQGISGAAWVRVPLFVAALGLTAFFAVLFVRAPPSADSPRPPEVRGGYGVDGPEARRVRRGLRVGAPLWRGDRDRALAQARRSLSKTTRRTISTKDRYLNVATLGYLLMLWLLGSPSLTAPRFESSDLRTLAVLVLIAVAMWLLGRFGLPGRQWRRDRLRRRIEVLENHPVAE